MRQAQAFGFNALRRFGIETHRHIGYGVGPLWQVLGTQVNIAPMCSMCLCVKKKSSASAWKAKLCVVIYASLHHHFPRPLPFPTAHNNEEQAGTQSGDVELARAVRPGDAAGVQQPAVGSGEAEQAFNPAKVAGILQRLTLSPLQSPHNDPNRPL